MRPSIAHEKDIVSRFKDVYQNLNATTVNDGLIESVYMPHMAFKDSFHDIEGRDAFVEYCRSLYENVKRIRFDFHEEFVRSNNAMLTWTMYYQHPRLNKGKEIAVEGASHLIIGESGILSHQDYFDGGQLLYEQVPVLGSVIQTLKKRLAS